MLAQLKVAPILPAEIEADHILVLLPKTKALPQDSFQCELLSAVLRRRDLGHEDLSELPCVSANSVDGQLIVWVMLDFSQPMALLQTRVRKAMMALLQENPLELAVVACGSVAQRQLAAEVAAYIAWVNGVPTVDSLKAQPRVLQEITLYGADEGGLYFWQSLAAGNLLCRTLSLLPASERTPLHYRAYVQELAQLQGWQWTEYDASELAQLGAGAFLALDQRANGDAAIVHLAYRHPDAMQTVALVGQGLCLPVAAPGVAPISLLSHFAQEMSGSAVCLGVLLAATQQQLPLDIDCWLAISRDELSSRDAPVVASISGLTIEHCGNARMVLADALTLALQQQPDVLIDFSGPAKGMAVALGQRASGVFSNDETLLQLAIEAGQQCGERLVAFPLDDDYAGALESDIADVRQGRECHAADHILAAFFLRKFVGNTPWLHIDLAAARCQGGLAAISSEITGFGVLWGGTMLAALSQQQQEEFDL